MAVSAENILTQIRDEARVHEQARQMSHKDIIDIAEKDERLSKRMANYQERQQCIENQLAKVQQHAQERSINIAKDSGNVAKVMAELDYKEASDDGSGRATADGQKTLKDATDELGRNQQTADKTIRDQIIEDAKRWNKDFKAAVAEKAQFKQFQGALKTDLQLVQGKMQLLTTLPGMQTLLAAAKFALARLLRWFLKTDLGERIFGKFGPALQEVAEEQAKTSEGIAKVIDIFTRKEITPGEGPEPKGETFKGANQFGEYETETSRVRDKEQYRDPKTGRYAPDPSEMKLGDNLKRSYNNFKGGIKKFSGTLSKQWGAGMKVVRSGFSVASKGLMTSITKTSAAMGTAAVGLGTTAAGLGMAALPFIAIGVGILLLVAALVAAGIWLYMQKDVIAEKWEIFKEKLSAGWDYIVDVGKMIGTWFSDKSTSIKLTIKHMIAVITDGIASIVNGLIEGMKEKFPRLAKYFNIDQYKMEGGAVDAVAKQRSDFEAMKQNRDMNTAGTAVLNAQGETTGQSGGGSNSTVIKGGDTISNKQTYIIEKTTSNDDVANEQNGPTL